MLQYSFKKVNQYYPKYMGNKELKRVAFIQRFIEALEDKNTEVFVLDEVGIGIVLHILSFILLKRIKST